MANLKQSTVYNRAFLMVQTSDHITGITGATVAVKISKAGATGGAAAGTVTQIDSTNMPGWYNIALTTADTGTLGDLSFHCTATSADPTDFVDQVTANILGDTLPANTTQLAGQTVTAGAGVTFPTSVASPTNITAGTITTATNLTNAPTAGDFTATMKTSLNSSTPTSVTTVTGNVNGSVASVTGAVGSVTGNVGGNVTGSIGSLGATAKTDVSTAVLTTTMTEAYPVKGSGFTLAAGIYNLVQELGERAIAGTTVTILKRDQLTTAKSYSLNSASNPTSSTEAS